MSRTPQAFEMTGVGRIIFGRGKAARIGELAAGLGRAALLIYNGTIAEQITRSFAEANVNVTQFRQRGEPVVSDVDAAVSAAKDASCNLVIGLGGGSAIDLAKATAGILGNGGAVLDYMEVIGRGLPLARPAAPWIAIPTTAGTGAEATRNAVIGLKEKQFKASLRSEHLYPRIALIDPELAIGVPPDVTARTGMDALCQLIESYTSTGAQPITDALALQGIRLAARSLKRAYENGADLDAREDMALAALLSGITLTNAGLGAVHGFAAPLGARFPVPHGTVCAVLLPPVIEANVAALTATSPEHPVLTRYAEVGRILAGKPGLEAHAGIKACIEETASLVRHMCIPSLRDFGLTQADIPGVVALARKASSMRFNPVVLSDVTLCNVLQRFL